MATPATPASVIPSTPSAPPAQVGSQTPDVAAMASSLMAALSQAPPEPAPVIPVVPIAPSLEPAPTPTVVEPPKPSEVLPAPESGPDLEDESFFDVSPEAKPAEAAPTPTEAAPAEPTPEAKASEMADMRAALSAEEQTTLDKLLASPRAAQALETTLLRSARGKRMLSSMKTLRDVEGEFGHIPSVDELKTALQAHIDFQKMGYDLANQPESFLLNWFGPDPQTGQLPPHAVPALTKLPEILLADPRMAPALGAIAAPIIQRLIDNSYATAANTNWATPEMRKQALASCQNFEFIVTGRSRQLGPEGEPAHPTAPVPNAELEGLRSQLAQERARNDGEMKVRAQQAEASISNQIFQSIQQDVETLFTKSNVSLGVPKTSPLYRGAIHELVNQVIDTVSGNPNSGTQPLSQAALDEFNIKLRYAVSGAVKGSNDLSAPVSHYRTLTRQAIRKLAPSFLQGVVAQAQEKAVAAAQSAQTAAAPSIPSPASGTPAQQSLGSSPQQGSNEDRVDFMSRTLLQGMQAVTRR